jgi:hypothetical protein
MSPECEIVRDTPELAQWIMGVLGSHFYGYRTAGVMRRGEFIAGILCDRFGLRECSLHIATLQGVRWATPELCREAFSFPFVYLGRERITTETPVSNTRMCRLNDHLGFVREGVKRKAADDGGDAVLFGMLRDECRWLKEST